MAIGPPPELAVARVQRWCRQRVPEHALSQVRVECESSGRDVTIVECRAPWSPDIGPEWTRFPVARLRYLTSRGVWRLYWRDRDGGWHEYPGLPFARDVGQLLEEVDRDPTALFWG
jgi:hypothetical protein